MKIRKGIFPKLVVAEAKNLKKYATKKEIASLNFELLDPRHNKHCIYGQMTGDCYSERADELIVQCAPRVYTAEGGVASPKNRLNGKPTGNRGSLNTDDRHYSGVKKFKYWSPIETFIMVSKDKMNEDLIKFIKGEKRTLKSK